MAGGMQARGFQICFRSFSKISGNEYIPANISSRRHVYSKFREVMRNVPCAVVVVTSAIHNEWEKAWVRRGVTCSSLASVSMTPPILSFCMGRDSQMHRLILESQKFAVNILASDQVHYAVRFSSLEDKEQFQNIPYQAGINNLPLLDGVCAHVQCKGYSVHEVGDHYVWYGQVIDTTCYDKEPLLYYARTFRNVGDEAFIRAFQDRTLLFEDWTHEAHIRMAWNYIREFGKEGATPYIKEGIKRFNEKNADKITRGYNETVTIFYIHMIHHALASSQHTHTSYEEFRAEHPQLTDKNLIFKYYSSKTIASPLSKHEFIPPDILDLP